MIRWWIIPLLLCLLLAAPALAIDINTEAISVNQYSVVAEPGYVIYQIIIDPVAMGTNQTHTLNYESANFLLTINTAQTYGIYNDFWVTLQYPNGSVDTVHKQAIRISDGTYKTTIQPIFTQIQSVTPAWKIDLNIGLNPVTVMFTPNNILEFNPSSSIPFSAASGSLGATTNVFVHQITKVDFDNNVVKYNPVFGLENLGSAVFQWTWNGVLGFMGMIPVIGPILVSFLTIAGTVLTELFFWLQWIVWNFPAILLSIETLIMMMAVINAPKGKRALGKVLSNIYRYNIAVGQGFMALFNYVLVWLSSIVQIVTSIVQALKPL